MGKAIQLSDHFSYGRLIRFTWPSMMMLLVTSVYTVVDGVMVSNFAGTTPFAALNLVWPFVGILGSVGFMVGTGGSALVAKTLGRRQTERARDLFSMLTYAALALGVVLGAVGLFVVKDVVIALGAEGEMVGLSVEYGSILLAMLPAYVMQIYFQSMLITAERPKMGMWITIGAGLMNVVLDILFIGVWHWGLSGAAWATGISQVVGGGVPLAFFIKKTKSQPHNPLKGENHLDGKSPLGDLGALAEAGAFSLSLGRCRLDWRALGHACYNGMSEFVMQISISVVSMLYMYQLLREIGENGVAAYGIMAYFAFTFAAVFIGFGIGTAPVVSYHYGAMNNDELRSLYRKSLWIVAATGIVIVALAQLLAHPLCAFFVGYDDELLALTIHAFRIYSLMFLVTGFNVFASAFFTALNNGFLSALISMMRTIIFEAGCVMVLPLIFGIEGIWWSVLVAEAITMMFSFIILQRNRGRYGY